MLRWSKPPRGGGPRPRRAAPRTRVGDHSKGQPDPLCFSFRHSRKVCGSMPQGHRRGQAELRSWSCVQGPARLNRRDGGRPSRRQAQRAARHSLDPRRRADDVVAARGARHDRRRRRDARGGRAARRHDTIEIERRSTIWERAGMTIACGDDDITVRTWVSGSGALAEVHLRRPRARPGAPTGFFPTGSSFKTLFSPNPGDPGKLLRSAAENAVIGVSGDGGSAAGTGSSPRRRSGWGCRSTSRNGSASASSRRCRSSTSSSSTIGRATARSTSSSSTRATRAPTALRGAAARPPAARRGSVRGAARSPDRPRAPRDSSRARVRSAAWWTSRCSAAGARSATSRRGAAPAPGLATQERYDAFLATLETRGVVPGQIVIDDKWQAAYGTNIPDPESGPTCEAGSRDRHDEGQRVLLWWKAWDPEGLGRDLCFAAPTGGRSGSTRTTRGRTTPCASRSTMLSAGGLDADGLKIDFTARTPSGRALTV